MRATSLALPLLMTVACSGDGGAPRPITQHREVEVTAGRDKVAATSAERFGSMRDGSDHGGATATPLMARLFDSVAPLVKTISLASAPISAPICPRAVSTAFSASQPYAWLRLAELPNLSRK